MAYQQTTITALTSVPALVKTFANANGFTTGGTSGNPTISVPAGLTFTLSASGSEIVLSNGTQNAHLQAPIRDSGTLTPTKVSLFGAQTPQPHIAIVVEFGYNLYRHLYLGYLERSSAFTGGEVIAAANFFQSNSGYDFPLGWRDTRHQWLFSAHQKQWGVNDCGGVRVVHANNANTYRRFRAASVDFGSWNAWDGNEVLGGFTDDVNDGYVARGRSSFAGAAILTPVNLYATRGTGSGAQFSPIGIPSGVRMVNVTDIDPDTSVTIGTDVWQLFPMFRKSALTSVPRGSTYLADETSGMVGVAYLK